MKIESRHRTRHDFFYFQIATRYFVSYNNLWKQYFSDKCTPKLNNLTNNLSEYVGKNYTREELLKILEELGIKEFNLKFFQMRTFATVTIVFSALCLEALINDYCITKKSANYFNQYIDKLDPVSKWLLAPQLITGKEAKTGDKAFELIKDLFSIRNKLVHPKSKQIDNLDVDNKNNPLVQELAQLLNNTPKAYIAIAEATKKLYELDPEFESLKEYEWLRTGDISKMINLSDPENMFFSLFNKSHNSGKDDIVY